MRDLSSDEAEFGERRDDRSEESAEGAGHVERLVVVVESGEAWPGGEHVDDGLPMLVGDREPVRSVAGNRAELREESVQPGEALQRHRHGRHRVADVVRLKDALVLDQQLPHRLHARTHAHAHAHTHTHTQWVTSSRAATKGSNVAASRQTKMRHPVVRRKD